MCILDFLTNASSKKSLSDKYHHFIMSKNKHGSMIYVNDNISMMEKRKLMNSLQTNFMLERQKKFEAKTATFDFSSDDRERSSSDGEEENDKYNSTCTLCTSSFSFCNTSLRSLK